VTSCVTIRKEWRTDDGRMRIIDGKVAHKSRDQHFLVILRSRKWREGNVAQSLDTRFLILYECNRGFKSQVSHISVHMIMSQPSHIT
jgi:hypothetical protein